jgi:hypothetical protein
MCVCKNLPTCPRKMDPSLNLYPACGEAVAHTEWPSASDTARAQQGSMCLVCGFLFLSMTWFGTFQLCVTQARSRASGAFLGMETIRVQSSGLLGTWKTLWAQGTQQVSSWATSQRVRNVRTHCSPVPFYKLIPLLSPVSMLEKSDMWPLARGRKECKHSRQTVWSTVLHEIQHSHILQCPGRGFTHRLSILQETQNLAFSNYLLCVSYLTFSHLKTVSHDYYSHHCRYHCHFHHDTTL